MNNNPSQIGKPVSCKRELHDLLLHEDNKFCADCGAPDPKWASTNIGVFLCLKCCGVHRSLGTHISKVLSVTLDEWSEDDIDAMVEVGGNASVNAVYEALFPQGHSKPGPRASPDERSAFIRSKYELQEFMKPSLRLQSTNSTHSTISTKSDKISSEPSLSQKIMGSFRSSHSPKNSEAGMVEFIGLLKVKVIKGTNLTIKDFRSSDPYVILTLGQQTVRTKVQERNLNPIWNEVLMLSVPQHYGPLKLEVFDHDALSADDIMGNSEINLQPIISSAIATGDAKMFGDMQIGKWQRSEDNGLLDDSHVNIVDGKVKQEVSLKLSNTETGEIYLELEWIPLDQ